MLLSSRRLSKTDSSAGNRSIGGSLALYWLCMVLAMLAAALLLLLFLVPVLASADALFAAATRDLRDFIRSQEF